MTIKPLLLALAFGVITAPRGGRTRTPPPRNSGRLSGRWSTPSKVSAEGESPDGHLDYKVVEELVGCMVILDELVNEVQFNVSQDALIDRYIDSTAMSTVMETGRSRGWRTS